MNNQNIERTQCIYVQSDIRVENGPDKISKTQQQWTKIKTKQQKNTFKNDWNSNTKPENKTKYQEVLVFPIPLIAVVESQSQLRKQRFILVFSFIDLFKR
jgi:hypothetical protein